MRTGHGHRSKRQSGADSGPTADDGAEMVDRTRTRARMRLRLMMAAVENRVYAGGCLARRPLPVSRRVRRMNEISDGTGHCDAWGVNMNEW